MARLVTFPVNLPVLPITLVPFLAHCAVCACTTSAEDLAPHTVFLVGLPLSPVDFSRRVRVHTLLDATIRIVKTTVNRCVSSNVLFQRTSIVRDTIRVPVRKEQEHDLTHRVTSYKINAPSWNVPGVLKQVRNASANLQNHIHETFAP